MVPLSTEEPVSCKVTKAPRVMTLQIWVHFITSWIEEYHRYFVRTKRGANAISRLVSTVKF
jgi:hypothetical protein